MLTTCASSYSASTNAYFDLINKATAATPKPEDNSSAISTVASSAPVDTSNGVNIVV
jgi:hypothetical protein